VLLTLMFPIFSPIPTSWRGFTKGSSPMNAALPVEDSHLFRRMYHARIQDKTWTIIIEHNICVPIRSSLPPAPVELLKTIYCRCKTNCDSKRCNSRKHGLEKNRNILFSFLRLTTLCDKVCQWLVTGRWFSRNW
jgi:hypothetical protein